MCADSNGSASSSRGHTSQPPQAAATPLARLWFLVEPRRGLLPRLTEGRQVAGGSGAVQQLGLQLLAAMLQAPGVCSCAHVFVLVRVCRCCVC